jgi:predicted ATPase
MFIRRIKIVGFRGLESIDIEIPPGTLVTAIVGPNGVGKSTLLEAIRLAKSVLSPTMTNEGQEVLASIGAFIAASQKVDFSSLCKTPADKVTIRIDYLLASDELTLLERLAGQWTNIRLRNTLGRSAGMSGLALVQYLSTPQGQALQATVAASVQVDIEKLKAQGGASLDLLIDPANDRINGTDQLGQEALTVLTSAMKATQGLMSLFPADRALPTGEIAIQLGYADAQQQLRSHLISPSVKYSRLKNFIVTQTLNGDGARQTLKDDFALIFDRLMIKKEFVGLAVNEHGAVKVLIRDSSAAAPYDIDYMSSGEKGLILMFLMMLRSVAPGGIILLDEPELHLNPAVEKKMLPFIIEEVLRVQKRQAIICTHSAEILTAAFESNDCRLYHLIDSRTASPILPQDKRDLFDALSKLGVNASQFIFSKGTIFVEGDDDVDLLESAFRQQLVGRNLVPLFGRGEVENRIRELQEQESRGQLQTRQSFIFDHDNRPSTLKSTDLVKVIQLNRYCLENYLLDPDVLYDALVEFGVGAPPANRGVLRNQLKALAFRQIDLLAAREAFENLKATDEWVFSAEDVGEQSSPEEVAGAISNRLSRAKEVLARLDVNAWRGEFAKEMAKRKSEMESDWESTWANKASGKDVLKAIHGGAKMRVSLMVLKKDILRRMGTGEPKHENWRSLESVIREAVNG